MIEVTQEKPNENWHDMLSLYLARSNPIQTVELQTSEWIQALQEKGYVTWGLTARERDKWYDAPVEGIDHLTVSQPRSVGITFSTSAHPPWTADPAYYEGVFFAVVESLKKPNYAIYFKTSSIPPHIVFVDDKLAQVESVDAVLTELAIPHTCYEYTTQETKNRRFDPLIANIQLYTFYHSHRILSDEEAAQVAQQKPSWRTEDYLNAFLSEFKMPTEEAPSLKAYMF